MRVLSDHGLVGVDKSSQELLESRGYSIHGCVHSWTVHVLNQEWDYDLARVAVACIASHVPGKQAIRPWLTQRRLLQHAARCSYIVLHGLALDNGMAWAYHNLGLLYADQGKLALAERMYERALGADNIITYIPALNTLWSLGSLFKRQADFTKARVIYPKALAGYKKVVGPEHPKCQSLQEILQDLETISEREVMKGREDPASEPQGNISRLDSKGALSTLK